MNKQKLKKLIRRYHVPENVLNHMIKVTALGLFLGSSILKKGRKINLTRIKQAGLLHDILKVCDFRKIDPSGFAHKVTKKDLQVWLAIRKQYEGLGHVEAGALLLDNIGESHIAGMIRKHRLGAIIDADPSRKPQTFEEKIIYYSDKKVKHDRIVSLKERLDDLSKRYKKDPGDDSLEKIAKQIIRLEKELCTSAGLSPGQITENKIVSSRFYREVLNYLS